MARNQTQNRSEIRNSELMQAGFEKLCLQAGACFIVSVAAWLLVSKHGLQTGTLMLLGFLSFAGAQLLLCKWAHMVPKPLVLWGVVGTLLPAVLIAGLIS